MTKLHRKLSLPLRRSPQMTTESKHPIQTAISIAREIINASLRIINHRVPLIQQADDISLELSRSRDDGFHQRFEDLGLAFHESFPKRLLCCILERQF